MVLEAANRPDHGNERRRARENVALRWPHEANRDRGDGGELRRAHHGADCKGKRCQHFTAALAIRGGVRMTSLPADERTPLCNEGAGEGNSGGALPDATGPAGFVLEFVGRRWKRGQVDCVEQSREAPLADTSSLKTIRLNLGRSADYPEGSASHGYRFTAPLDGEGHLDAEGWRENRDAAGSSASGASRKRTSAISSITGRAGASTMTSTAMRATSPLPARRPPVRPGRISSDPGRGR